MKNKAIFFLLSVVVVSFFILPSIARAADALLLDDFEGEGNLLGGRSNTYEKEPSRALAMRVNEEYFGDKGRALMIRYHKKTSGGPYGSGGWCGYYTMLRVGAKFFDAAPYASITFQVKGAEGGENFKIGLADKHWEELGDSIKSGQIIKYLPEGKVTADWQKAAVPLEEFFLDYKEIASIAICFENDCFPEGAGRGTIYIDDLRLE